MDKHKEIFKQLMALSIAMGTEQKPERLTFYANALMDYDLPKIMKAIAKVSKANKFFPQLVEIIEATRGPEVPTDELANQIAGDIMDAIPKFGRYQEQEAKTSLGASFGVVERFGGGWQYLCSIQNDEVPTIRAQLRELAKAFINRSKRECAELGIEFSLNTAPIQIAARENKPGLKLVSFKDLTS